MHARNREAEAKFLRRHVRFIVLRRPRHEEGHAVTAANVASVKVISATSARRWYHGVTDRFTTK